MLSESRSLTNLDSCRCSISIDDSRALHEPPWYGTVCPVVWEVGGSNPATYPICTDRAEAETNRVGKGASEPLETKRRQCLRGHGLVLLAAMLCGTTRTAQTFAPPAASPLTVGGLRLVLGGGSLLLLVLLRGRFGREVAADGGK